MSGAGGMENLIQQRGGMKLGFVSAGTIKEFSVFSGDMGDSAAMPLRGKRRGRQERRSFFTVEFASDFQDLRMV